MLLELYLKNYIIFESERVEFSKGLNVITGETGSGKSIIIDAIEILCGGRFIKDDIKSGSDKAFIEGIFEINDSEELDEMMDSYGITKEKDNILLIQREVSSNGRSLSRINGQTVTLSALKKITQSIIDIVAQNEHQLLFDASYHIQIIDSFDSKEVSILKDGLEVITDELKSATTTLDNLYGTGEERERKLDLLKYQINEIESANLKIDEPEKLKTRKAKLINAEKLYNAISGIYEILYSEQDFNKSVLDNLSNCVNELNDVAAIDPELKEYKDVVENSLYQLDDIKGSLRLYRDNIEFNSSEIDALEERLSVIDKLSKKYGNTIEKIIAFAKDAQNEYTKLNNSGEEISKLEEKILDLKKSYSIKAKSLSNIRNSISKRIEKKVETELNALNMEGARFLVKNEIKDDFFNKNGNDNIEFLLAANPGEQERALAKVASGGEVSRIMLALKTVLIEVENVNCIVFDEIDAGIGGVTANMVAKKLKRISESKQTLCITHLAQIASVGDNHIHVCKYIEKNKTYGKIKQITHEERIKELAKLIDGGKASELSIDLAKELLNNNLKANS